MIKYNLTKVICMAAIVITALVCSYMIYDNIMDYHADSVISYDASVEVAPDPDIELAVLRSEEEGSPYNIRGLLCVL